MYVHGVSVLGQGLAADGPEGLVFSDLDLRVEPGSLAAVTGPGGSGRTALLLVLSGRMRALSGWLEVDGLRLPRQARKVRKLVQPARIRPGCELEEWHTVGEAIKERRLIGDATRRTIESGFALVGLDPDPHELIGELPDDEQLLLALALAAANAPGAIVVDDVEKGLPAEQRARVWAVLRDLTRIGMTVIAGSTDPPSGEVDVIRLADS